MPSIRRLGEGDEPVLRLLAREGAEFDIEGRTETVAELDPQSASVYLRNPDILHWVAEREGRIDGFLLCYVQYKWHAPARELMLYEIGVRSSARRRGIGQALIETMETWMRENGIEDVWVPADNLGAEAFYRACGFVKDEEQAVMMSKTVGDQNVREQQ
jgi:ribosomal protein S18 acetylase RimI-like enzyme